HRAFRNMGAFQTCPQVQRSSHGWHVHRGPTRRTGTSVPAMVIPSTSTRVGNNSSTISAQVSVLGGFSPSFLAHHGHLSSSIMMTRTPRELLTPEQAAERLGLKNPNTLAVWRSTQRYHLPFIRVGRNIRYDAAEIEKFLQRNTESGQGAS